MEETAYWGDVDEADEDVEVGVEDVEPSGAATMELDIDEEDAHAIIRFADMLKQAMGVEGAEGVEEEPGEEEPELEFEPEEEEEEMVEKCDPPCEEGETCIDGECVPEEEEEEEEEGEAEAAPELTERKTDDVVKEIAARVAARLLKKKK